MFKHSHHLHIDLEKVYFIWSMNFSFIGISQSILATSYVKWIDVWMIFMMVVPFLEASHCSDLLWQTDIFFDFCFFNATIIYYKYASRGPIHLFENITIFDIHFICKKSGGFPLDSSSCPTNAERRSIGQKRR